MKYFILLTFVLSACSAETQVEERRRDELTAKYKMICTHDLNNVHLIYRCENDEAVCYDHDMHPFCKFK